MEKDKICVCGDPESQHIDGCESCVVCDCGCREFEEEATPEEIEADRVWGEKHKPLEKPFTIEETIKKMAGI